MGFSYQIVQKKRGSTGKSLNFRKKSRDEQFDKNSIYVKLWTANVLTPVENVLTPPTFIVFTTKMAVTVI